MRLLALLALLPVLLTPAAASARVHLLSATPAAGSIVAAGPLAVSLHFDSALDPVRSRMMLTGPSGAPTLMMVPPPTDDHAISTTAPVTPGAYHLHWQVWDRDGRMAEGDLPFSVAP
ncbi:copper resistance protein CopC [Gluconacetobacter azotocaptans]|uniref:Copper resistance protein CopC n=1 Tax=Gluconacetobacter azotocaptans TaxID=142834 RepID=A0A7W4JQS4_9PROT|nr:copper resistance CopC family protein [Gluconacetobacter azotocaptans]MBB2189138.1 copper resistance protein CopC [Gluconacetobacter azotocaptans]MBM9403374.1 copper resistance protein CopC [Gluconacetobacter azotocaptans]